MRKSAKKKSSVEFCLSKNTTRTIGLRLSILLFQTDFLEAKSIENG